MLPVSLFVYVVLALIAASTFKRSQNSPEPESCTKVDSLPKFHTPIKNTNFQRNLNYTIFSKTNFELKQFKKKTKKQTKREQT